MKRRLVITSALIFAGIPALAGAQGFTCDSAFVNASLEWCALDRGFNEGATCSLGALSAVHASGLPSAAPQPVLGNTWSRASVIQAARQAAKEGGQADAGANAAICCQTHNPLVRACLAQRKADVVSWLRR